MLGNFPMEKIQILRKGNMNRVKLLKMLYNILSSSLQKLIFSMNNLKFKIAQVDKSYPNEIINNIKKYKKWIETN